ncbi:ADP-glyceromanno-heptose 6-epimerase [Formicincola oecophyllae]|uniref:ADP-glyceromanno-heptose 6-epimerase n=1 Tax=Formicincola oecophyllae TaxID=2558361 RepID=A0A4Y6U901_9PROT|nr:ADP-glyceromanno-heptose 6-epimerase [Formicincola oecophyllae]QDH13480.1 ADP-glyceromanno-heptose 6-epimerase [Formicincola oecophyllae]
MILITGGAGFIGSCLQERLFAQNRQTIVADWLGGGASSALSTGQAQPGRWRNLAAHPPLEVVAPEALSTWLERAPALRAVVHLGAISETTAKDGDLVWRTNVALPQQLWRWCARARVPFIYASSAATYGSAVNDFRDGLEGLERLRPTSLYGWSKQAFDLWVCQALERGHPSPPQWAGLKFFNVYGPNEYHKGAMMSVIKVKYDELAAGRPLTLFKSDDPSVADGQQKRDFIWVGDCVDVVLWLLRNPHVCGLFNCGTGQARSYSDLARAVCQAADRPEAITYVPMPQRLQGQYQYYTQANMDALREAGYQAPFTPLEEGVRRYVQSYLMQAGPAGPRTL